MKIATLELLEQITDPNNEQIALMDYVKELLNLPATRTNRQIISECMGRIWILIK